MKRIMHASSAAALLVAAAVSPAAAGPAERPTVVELFTSQGCYSCPPAEAYLGELAQQPGIVALEFHVDYWDDLVYGLAGKWKDPFSSPDHTERQRRYNVEIRRTGSVYTPQMVIGGAIEAVGSRRADVGRAIARVEQRSAVRPTVAVERKGPRRYTVAVAGKTGAPPAAVWLVRFKRNVTTKVRSGENKGKTLTSRHIVSSVEKIGDWAGRPLSLDIALPGLGAGEGCAVLVQSPRPGPILGAAYCPAAGAS